MLEQEEFLEGKTVVLLDLDGTLVKSVEAHAKSWLEVFKKHGHEPRLYDLERLIGLAGEKLIDKAIGVTDTEEIKQIEEERSKLFREKYLYDVFPVEKADLLVNALRARGLQVYLATASSPVDRDALLKRGGLSDHFHDFVAPEEVEESKPAPDLIQAILARHDIHPSHCLFVGDSPFDAEAAYEAGVSFVGVESGWYTRDELPNAVAVFPSVKSFCEVFDPPTEGSTL